MSMKENEKVAELLRGFRFAMLVTRSSNGETRARPMVIANVEDSRIWFVTGKHSGTVEEIAKDARVTLTLQSSSEFLSIVGRAEVRDDRAKLDELWNVAFQVWFPKGKEDPDLALVSVTMEEAEYWDNAGANKVKYFYEAAKALLTGTRPEANDKEQHGRVRM